MSCGKTTATSNPDEDAKIISRTVRDMEILSSGNGLKERLMRAPLMEEHAFADPAFEEFRQGMEVIGYDSLGVNPSSRVVSDHALHWTERDLWQLSGNVLVEGEEGQKLYTQQLFWDRKTHKIWSNVDSKFEEGGGVVYGVGFEAMDDFKNAVLRGADGTMEVDVAPTETPAADSVAVAQDASPASDSVAIKTSGALPAASTATSPATDSLTTRP